MKQKHTNIAWFYNFTIMSNCIMLKPGKKKMAATLVEALELFMQGGSYLVLDKNFKAVHERLWVPEHGQQVIIFDSRKNLKTILQKLWNEFLQEKGIAPKYY